MMRGIGTAALCVLLAVAGQSVSAELPTAGRPNIVLIVTDDLGYGDLASYGATDIRTPHLDRLAREGVRLTDFYANGAFCTPTRAALMTGRYQQRFALEEPMGANPERDYTHGLKPTGRSLPRLLQDAGYATALVGKWHLGWQEEFSPRAHGFGYFFGFKSGYVDYYRHTPGRHSPIDHDLFENETPVEADGQYLTDLITERAVRFIEEQAGQPFFIDVSHGAPHWPYQRPDDPSTAPDQARHLGPLDDPTSSRADYVSMVERMDEGIGRILDTLDRLGLSDDTLVIFTNDNGGEWLSDNLPLFHYKGSVWEGGIRVPTILRWPGRIAAGSTSSLPAITMDLTATMLAAAGATPTAAARLEGIDLMPMLTGSAEAVPRTLFWRVLRPWQQKAARAGRWKLVVDGNRPLLFDIASDVGERENLSARHPEVVRQLHARLEAWEADVDAEAGN